MPRHIPINYSGSLFPHLEYHSLSLENGYKTKINTDKRDTKKGSNLGLDFRGGGGGELNNENTKQQWGW